MRFACRLTICLTLAACSDAQAQVRPAGSETAEPKERSGAAVGLELSSGRLAAALPLKRSDLAAQFDPFLRCGVEADADCGDGYAWACRTRDGSAVTVTNKCGSGAEQGPFYDAGGVQARGILVRATRPSLTGAVTDALGLPAVIAGAHTVVVVARATTKDDANPIVLGYGGWMTRGIRIQSVPATAFRCYSFQSGAQQSVSATATTIGAWVVGSCTYNGSNSLTARANGNATSGAVTAITTPSNDTLYFGNEAGQPLGGPLAQVLIYDRQLTSAELSAIEADVAGLGGRTLDATVDANSARYVLGNDGKWQAEGQDILAATPTGADIWESVTNYWADSLDASAWVDVATPTITVDQASGPWSTYSVGAEADNLDDNDAGALEGKESASAGTTTGSYTVSCYLASNTASDYTLSVVTDGTGGGSCTGTGLTSSYALKTCTPTAVGGVPTYVKGRVLVGDTAADTGAIRVSGCQLTRTAYQQRACVAAGSAATCLADVVSVPSTGWPISHGRVTLRYTPGVSPTAVAANSRFVDLRETAGGNSGWLLQVTTGGVLSFVARNAGTDASCGSGVLTWTPGTTYSIDARFRAGSMEAYVDGVQVIAPCVLAQVPGSIAGTVYIGASQAVSNQVNGRISDVTIWR